MKTRLGIGNVFNRRSKKNKTRRYKRNRFSMFAERLEARNLLATFVVNSMADGFDAVPGDGVSDDGSGASTLRGAIQEANALPGPDTIVLPAGNYVLSIPGAGDDFAFGGDLDITGDLTITGAGAGSTVVDAAGLDRVFHIPQLFAPVPVSAVTLDGLTIKGGIASDAGGFGTSFFASSGGGILNEIFGASITLSNSVVTDNTAVGSTLLFSSDAQGGGIADVGGNWTISNSEIVNNDAQAVAGPFGPGTGRGGGVYAEVTTTNLLIDTTVANNLAVGGSDDGLVGAGAGQGGGIFGNTGTWAMAGSTTVEGNQAKGGSSAFSFGGVGEGGGIYSQGSFWNFSLSPGVVLSSNAAIGGDGVFAGGAAAGGGIYSAFDFWYDPLTFSPIANNTISGNRATGGNADPGFGGGGGSALGGGIFTLGTIIGEHLTIAENEATGGSGAFAGPGEGGGIYSGAGGVNLKSTIVADNTASSLNPDLSGAFISAGYNLIGDVGTATGFGLPGDLVGTAVTPVDPLLGPLQNNGGPTETHQLLAGSPAIDAADPFSLVLSDQRGVGRPIDGDVDTIAVNDIGAYEAAAPAAGADIAIEKLTNGVDADAATGPLIGVGNVANFTYVVTNPGGVALSNVVVTDSQGVVVSFVGGDIGPANGLLDPGETWTYSGSTTVTAGQYVNTGTVTADDPSMNPVMDTDDSHHFGVQLGIGIEKSTGGVDADSAPGPEILVGGTASFTYTVTNTGNVALENVAVSDSEGVVVTYQSGDTDADNELDVSETWIYTGSTIVTAGQYMNTGTAVGDDATDTVPGQVMTTDDSHYFGAAPQIAIEKLVSVDGGSTFVDADSPDGPTLVSGGPAPEYKFEVTLGSGAGAVDLDNIVVSDPSLGGAITGPSSGDDGDGILEAGETWVYLATGTWAAGQNTNTASADGDFTDSQANTAAAPTAADAANYFGADPLIDIEKATNGIDADDPPGPTLTVDDTVTFTYVISNTGNVDFDIAGIVVIDSVLGAITNIINQGDGDSLLELSESWTYEATSTVLAGQYMNTGTVTANFADDAGNVVTATDSDNSHYFGEDGQQPGGGEGCTPGFWKTHSQYGPAPEAGWDDTDYDPDQLVDDVFGTTQFGTTTLLEAMETGGGGVNALMRHAVAALLNASNPNISYDLTAAEVIQMTNDALAPSGDVEGTKDIFADFNEQGCDLSPGGGGSGPGDPGDPQGATVQGMVWIDTNGNGQVEFGEEAVQNVTVSLTGYDAEGNFLTLSEVTDDDGIYQFDELPPSDANGYTMTETQPAGFDNDREYAGSINGTPVGDDADIFDDEFTLWLADGDVAEDFNFAELVGNQTGVYLEAGMTATIGFWQNKNGQALIESVNGGANDTQLGHWLAGTFPAMYGATSADPVNGLAGKTNAEVAAYFKTIFKTKKKRGAGPTKIDPQAMAVALSVYVTDRGLAGGDVAEDYGFSTSDPIAGETGMAGTGGRLVDVDQAVGAGTAETLFGAGTPSVMTVMDVLTLTDQRSSGGAIFEDPNDGDSEIDFFEAMLRSLANDLYTFINETGDI